MTFTRNQDVQVTSPRADTDPALTGRTGTIQSECGPDLVNVWFGDFNGRRPKLEQCYTDELSLVYVSGTKAPDGEYRAEVRDGLVTLYPLK